MPRTSGRLLRRTSALPSESLVSFLERLRILNFYETARWICSYRHPNILSGADEYRALSQATGLSIEDIFHLTLHRFAPFLMSPDTFQKVREYRISVEGIDLPAPCLPSAELERYTRAQTQIVICPQCWQENHSILLPNSLRFVTTCPWHQSILIDRCPCGSILTLPLEHGCCKACGTAFDELPTLSIYNHRPSLQMTDLIWSAIGCSSESFPPALLELPDEHPLHHMHPSELFHFLDQFSRIIKEIDPQHALFDQARSLSGGQLEAPPSRIDSAPVNFLHSILVTLTDLLISWPTGWTDLFTGIAELQSGRYVEKAFPKQMMEQFAGSRWGWMHDTWLMAFRETFGCNASVYPWIRYYDEIQTQVYPKTLTPVFRISNYYSPLEIQVRKQKHLIGLSQAATYLGVDERQVVVLTAAGLIEAIHGPLFDESLVWVFDRADLQRFLKSFLAPIPLNLDSRPEKSGLSSIVGITHVGQMFKDASISFARLLLDLQLGNLAAMRCNDVLSFQSLVFEHVSVMDYITRLRDNRDCALVGMDETCAQLQCDHRLLRWWYGTGVLIPACETIGFHDVCWQYHEEDVKRVALYLDFEEAAQLLGISTAVLERWIWADQIPALKTPPWMALKNPAMFDKEELIAWRNTRLTRDEAAKLLGLSSCAMTEWIRDKKIVPMEVMVNGRQWYSRQDLEELARERLKGR